MCVLSSRYARPILFHSPTFPACPPPHFHIGRQYTRRVNDAIIGLLDAAAVTGVIPKGAVSAALKVIEPDWSDRIEKYMKTHRGLTDRVHASAAKYPDRVHYSRHGYAAMAAVLRKHLDRDCVDDADLEAAFVTSCQLESFFAVIDDTNRASNYISITENRGQAMAIKSHTFMTADERLRQEMKRRKKSKLSPLTPEEVPYPLSPPPPQAVLYTTFCYKKGGGGGGGGGELFFLPRAAHW